MPSPHHQVRFEESTSMPTRSAPPHGWGGSGTRRAPSFSPVLRRLATGSRDAPRLASVVALGAVLLFGACSPEDPGGRMQLDGGTPNWPSPDGSLDYLDGYRPDTPQGERDAGSPDSTDATRDGSVPRRDAPDSVSDAAPAPDMAPVVDADPSCDPAPAPPKCEAGLVRDARTDPLTDCVIGWRCICPPPEQDEAPTCSVGRPERITNQAGCPMRFECRCPSAPAQPTCYFELEAEKDDDGCVVDWSCIEPAVCQHKEASGLPRNPGCDPDVITKGFSAIGRITEGEIYFTQGKKLWALYTASGGTFSAAVPDLATFLRQLATEDGVTNPGTDASIQAGGLDSLGAVAAGDERLVYITRKTRWWSYNLDRGAFVGNGDSLANALGAFSRRLAPPAQCSTPAATCRCKRTASRRSSSSPVKAVRSGSCFRERSIGSTTNRTESFPSRATSRTTFCDSSQQAKRHVHPRASPTARSKTPGARRRSAPVGQQPSERSSSWARAAG
jgi:hypothetical protein